RGGRLPAAPPGPPGAAGRALAGAAFAAVAAIAGAALRINRNAIGVSHHASHERPDYGVVCNRDVGACATSAVAAVAAIAASAVAAISSEPASATKPAGRRGVSHNIVYGHDIGITTGAARATP